MTPVEDNDGIPFPPTTRQAKDARPQPPRPGKTRWVIVQTGYRASDGSFHGFSASRDGPTRKLIAVCRSLSGAKRWRCRLERWAAERSNQAKMIPTYETMKAIGAAGLAGAEPALCVGPMYDGDRGPEASLRLIVLGVRESHAALRREARHRQGLVAGSGFQGGVIDEPEFKQHQTGAEPC